MLTPYNKNINTQKAYAFNKFLLHKRYISPYNNTKNIYRIASDPPTPVKYAYNPYVSIVRTAPYGIYAANFLSLNGNKSSSAYWKHSIIFKAKKRPIALYPR